MNEIVTYPRFLREAVMTKVNEALKRFFEINPHLSAQDVDVDLHRKGPYVRILIKEKHHESQSGYA